MNQIRAIQALNKREIENGVPPEASWHTDYRDTAFVNFGGLPYELSEGDIITIFSQYGEPVFLKLVRDKETGKSKGFGWLKYEDQRSTDLAVDNLGGAEINGRLIRVDHARYKARDDEDPEEFKVGWEDIVRREKAAKGEDVEMEESSEEEERRPMIKEEIELAKLIEEHDEDDPMKGFLIEEKKKEVERALRKEGERKEKQDRKEKHRHHHHRSHRSRKDDKDSEDRDRHRRSRRDETPVAKDRSRRDETPVGRGRSSRERNSTPPRRRNDSMDRERRRDDDRDRHRDRERRRDRDDRERHRDEKRSRRYDDEDGDRARKSRRRSRSRSPRSYRD
ncbi:hypothetical protein F5Y05DRAFT_387164 [Hypoxylon sp. FL0543]|nr:hypothetical protein F5Y05DRAFT_387164 [Hypoxylon sp. FL0543]